MALLAIDQLYQVAEGFHSGEPIEFAAEQILTSVEKRFNADSADSQNFLNMIVEEFPFFKDCNNVFERVKSMSSQLMASDHLSSKTTGYTAQTKLWIQSGAQGITKFADFLFETANNSEEPPHVRCVCSECLMAIWRACPQAVSENAEQLINAANTNLAPTVFSELAFCMGGQNDKLNDFYQKRWWSMAPFEAVVFDPAYKPEYPTVPNDPLLLHTAMKSKSVPKDTVLAMINSPLSGFGVPSVLLGFDDSFEVDGSELFTPYDSRGQVALKTRMLVPMIDSIEKNPQLAEFVTHSEDSPTVAAVFEFASLFSTDDLFEFFRRYYADTPAFDRFWIDLYNKQAEPVKETLKCFVSEYSDRVSAQTILLSDGGLPSIDLIGNIKDESLLPLLSRFAHEESARGLITRQKLNSFPESEVARQILNTKPTVELPIDPENKKSFSIVSRVVRTYDRTTTEITMSIESLLDTSTPIYAVSFTLTNPEFFESDATASVPSMTSACEVHFKLVPKKCGSCQLGMTCSYTTATGEIHTCRLTGDSHLVIRPEELLSRCEEPFASVWSKGHESRVRINMGFRVFSKLLENTVFETANDPLEATAVTPDGYEIAVRAVGNETATTVQFKAPSLDLLSLVDSVIRTLSIRAY